MKRSSAILLIAATFLAGCGGSSQTAPPGETSGAAAPRAPAKEKSQGKVQVGPDRSVEFEHPIGTYAPEGSTLAGTK